MNGSNQSRIKLHQLRALATIAAHGNFSEAALQLDISQSAISHAIAVSMLAEALHSPAVYAFLDTIKETCLVTTGQ